MSSAKYPLSFLTSIGGDTAMESIVLGWNSVRKSQRDLVLYFIQKPSLSYLLRSSMLDRVGFT